MEAGRLLDNRYRLGPLIGRGGVASVYSATDLRMRRAVAVKLFHPTADEVTVARLEAEARLLAGLSHPGLLRVFDVSTDAEQPYLVMELISGRTLRMVINRGPMEPTAVARIGRRLADVLRYVHSRHIVHRDVKPSNVLLDGSGECYLADFGIAKAVGAAGPTATGHCVGTAAYLAPEQVAGAQTGPATDIYALGLVLLECLTGRLEYPGTEAESAIARLSRPPRVPEWLPPALRETLVAMTARDPAERAEAAACVASLDAYLDGEAATPPNRTKILDTVPVPRRSRRLVHAGAAVAAVAGFAVATLLSMNGPEPGHPTEQTQPPAETAGAPVVGVQPQTAVEQVVVPPGQPRQQAPQQARGEEKPQKKKGGGKGRG